jgi:predicted glycosyltransferase
MPLPLASPQAIEVAPWHARTATASSTANRKIWIDLDNSPHVPFFAPIVDELAERGYTTMLTARDCFQVHDLADRFHLNYKLIGRHFGKNKIRKLAGLGWRALQLLPTVMRARPDLAVSHSSRSQLIVSTSLGIPSLAISDYEFSTGSAVIHPTWRMYPEVIPEASLPRSRNGILKYPGIKEDVYVPRFVPDPWIRTQLTITRRRATSCSTPRSSS